MKYKIGTIITLTGDLACYYRTKISKELLKFKIVDYFDNKYKILEENCPNPCYIKREGGYSSNGSCSSSIRECNIAKVFYSKKDKLKKILEL